jgi:hypothetical protein
VQSFAREGQSFARERQGNAFRNRMLWMPVLSAQGGHIGVEPLQMLVGHVDYRLVHQRIYVDVFGRHQGHPVENADRLGLRGEFVLELPDEHLGLVIRQLKLPSYDFAKHKDEVVDLLKRVTTVSVKTVEIVQAMKALPR